MGNEYLKKLRITEKNLRNKEVEVNRLSSAEREISKCKAILEEKEKLLEDSEVQKNKYLKKLRTTEKRLRNKELRIKALEEKEKLLEDSEVQKGLRIETLLKDQ